MKDQSTNIEEKEVANQSGGLVFKLDKWSALDRYLIMGSSTKYTSGKAGALDNKNLIACVAEDGVRVVDTAVAISEQGRAPKNDYAIYAIAYCMKMGDLTTRRAAGAAAHRVCRIGTHLFQLASHIDDLGGWGSIVKRTLQNWYLKKDAKALAYQMIKYQKRVGWSHRDILRKVRPVPPTEDHKALFKWATQGDVPDGPGPISQVWAAETLKAEEDVGEAVNLIKEFRLPRECVPTWHRKEMAVQKAALENMPMNAMIRSLSTMSASGLLLKDREAVDLIVSRFTDEGYIKKSRIHPLNILNSANIYSRGTGDRGSLTWTPVDAVSKALGDMFYKAFQNVLPSDKSVCIALDVSGSMHSPCAGLSVTCRLASAAMAMVTVHQELRTEVIGFTSGGASRFSSRHTKEYTWNDPSLGVSGLNIQPSMSLSQIHEYVSGMPFGGTDCAAPILWAMKEKKRFEVFVIYTDNETWAGKISPYKALQEYRRVMAVPARLVVVAMDGTDFTIANPEDPGMMDIVGCDTATPRLISDFASMNIAQQF